GGMDLQAFFPFDRSEGPEQSESVRGNLVASLGASDGARPIGIPERDADSDELMHRLPAYALSGMGCVDLAVVLGEELHHVADAASGVRRLAPMTLGRQVK